MLTQKTLPMISCIALSLELNQTSIENDNHKEAESENFLTTDTKIRFWETKTKVNHHMLSVVHNVMKMTMVFTDCYQTKQHEEYQRYKSQRSGTTQPTCKLRSKSNQSEDNKYEVIRNDLYHRTKDHFNEKHCRDNNSLFRNDRYRSNIREYSNHISNFRNQEVHISQGWWWLLYSS